MIERIDVGAARVAAVDGGRPLGARGAPARGEAAPQRG